MFPAFDLCFGQMDKNCLYYILFSSNSKKDSTELSLGC